MTRIGSQPTTDPAWIDQKIANDQELTPDEQIIAERQNEALSTTLKTLNQPVQKGDIKAAKARVDKLEETFKNLSTEDKQYMYNVLTSKSGLADKLEYKLSAYSREKLLKTLNPDHNTSQKVQNQISQEAKASKSAELKTSGASRQLDLQKFDSVPLGGRGFQEKISKDSGISSLPLGGKDFQQKVSQESGLQSMPLGGRDFQKNLPTGNSPSNPLGGKDFQEKISQKTGPFDELPGGWEQGITSAPLGGKKIDQ